MPTLEDKPRIDEEIVRKLLDEAGAAASALLGRLAQLLDALATRLDPISPSVAARETNAVLA